jgi:hypothetical protein
MKSLTFRDWARLTAFVYILFICQPIWANSCIDLFQRLIFSSIPYKNTLKKILHRKPAPTSTTLNLEQNRTYKLTHSETDVSIEIYGKPFKVGRGYSIYYRIKTKNTEETNKISRMTLSEFQILAGSTFYESLDIKKEYLSPVSEGMNPSKTNELLPVRVINISDSEVLVELKNGEKRTVSKKEFLLWNLDLNISAQEIITDFFNMSPHANARVVSYRAKKTEESGTYLLINKLPKWPGKEKIKNLFFDRKSYKAIKDLVEKGITIALTHNHANQYALAHPCGTPFIKFTVSNLNYDLAPAIVFTKKSNRTTIVHELRHYKDYLNGYKIHQELTELMIYYTSAYHKTDKVGPDRDWIAKMFNFLKEQRAYSTQASYIQNQPVTRFIDNSALRFWVTKEQYIFSLTTKLAVYYSEHISKTKKLLDFLKQDNITLYNKTKGFMEKWEIPYPGMSLSDYFPNHI